MTPLPTPQNDDELHNVMRRYFAWNEKHLPPPLDSLNGLRNIMLFVQDHLLDKVPLRNGLRDRLFEELNECRPFIDEKLSAEPRLKYAAEYVINTTQEKWGALDHDLKYWFMVEYMGQHFFNRHEEFKGIFSTLYHRIILYLEKKNITFAYEVGSSDFLEACEKEDGRRTGSLPVETHLLLGQIDLYYYTRQQLAFDKGMDLVESIDAYFIAPHAQDQLGSLLPSDGPTRIPLTGLKWLNTPAGKKYASILLTDGTEAWDAAWDIFVEL